MRGSRACGCVRCTWVSSASDDGVVLDFRNNGVYSVKRSAATERSRAGGSYFSKITDFFAKRSVAVSLFFEKVLVLIGVGVE